MAGIRRVHSPERSSSCLPFARFFHSKPRHTLADDVAYHDEKQLHCFNHYMTDYTDADLDSDEENEKGYEDEKTLNGDQDGPIFVKFDSGDRLKQLRKWMAKYKVGVYVIPSEDEHQSEYTAAKDRRRAYISGFTGSAGVAVVTLDDEANLSGEAALSTDGRYYLQAEQQLDQNWALLKTTIPSMPTWQQWTIQKASKNSFSKKISIDPKLIGFKNIEWLKKKSEEDGLEFSPVFENLIDLVWDDNGERPPFQSSTIYELKLQFSGVHANDKVKQVRQGFQKEECDSLVVSNLDDVAWLLNLRGDDINYNPVFFSYVIVTLDELVLFIDDDKVDSEALAYLKTIDGLQLKPYKQFWDEVSNLTNVMAPAEPSLALVDKANPKVLKPMIAEMKSIKNKTEIEGARSAQLKDSVALIRYFAWLEYHLVVKGEKINEWDAQEKLEEFRAVLPYYKSRSFSTISSTGPNGAIIHYNPTAEKSDIINPDHVYLCDAGAQFLDGTTDITRTLHFTKPRKEEVFNYTLVLKGHLALTMEVFIEGTTGAQLDILCRTPLWQHGLNYAHGSGHGIGSFLCVHEPPIYIGLNVAVQPNCFISDEPGYYKDGEYGLRLESDILCKETDKPKFNEKSFFEFEYFTKVPFCQRLIEPSLLTKEEVEWINNFNSELRKEIIPILEKDYGDVRAIRFLLRETQPLK